MGRSSRDSVNDIWGPRTPYYGEGLWPNRIDEHLLDQPDRWVQSCCVLCTNGCGLEIGVKNGRIVGVRGRADDRVSHGRLGPKGMNAWQANNSADRLTHPLIRDGKKPDAPFRQASWDEVMDLIAGRCRDVCEKYTSGAVGFYNSGQLFIEDYYTLSVMSHAGLGTKHVDGNTRLCTATASFALRETFGNDGNPASVTDYDTTDCLAHFGHNIANTQTVAWARILDRRRGPNPPRLIVVDPRRTDTAKEADVHLAPRLGTNVAVMNGLLNLVIANGDIDHSFIEQHTVGFEQLKKVAAGYPPARVAEITGIPAEQLQKAARILGSAQRLLCTVLQGFYQASEATAAACQVNNLVLVRGMIGKPGCGVIQSNGQPTAENTRETGCDGDFPGFRNWQNARHIDELARVWNVDPKIIPAWAPSTHAMHIFRLAEEGAIKFLWIIATNPAVSLPELHRVRRTLEQERLFVVVQDAFLTETARLADVVLPAAIWGEKTGTFTNYERTVHISHKAVDPPGEARPDMDIFLDFARRMDFRDKDGGPLLKWSTPEECFEAWKDCSKGTPCDYSGMSYALLSSRSGVQWPCNEEYPEGKERLYDDFHFPTGYEECGDFGHDLETGGHILPVDYKANDPRGRAFLKPAEWRPPHEEPDDDYPFFLTTGRIVYHFHTRTKTGRSPELQTAAPEPFVQINQQDAERLGIIEGDLVEVTSRRGKIVAPARLGDVLPGHLFVPFHYGYFDQTDSHRYGPDGHGRAANELTLTVWDVVSKQPSFKYAAVRLTKAGTASLASHVIDTAGQAMDRASELVDALAGGTHPAPRSHVSDYLSLLVDGHQELIEACEYLGRQHGQNAEIREGAKIMANLSRQAIDDLRPFVVRYGQRSEQHPHRLRQTLFSKRRTGGFGLLRDLHGLHVLCSDIHMSVKVLKDAARELRDMPLHEVCLNTFGQNQRQQAWIDTMIKESAADSVVIPS
ncbi:MAG TPA: nitrate reductase [Pirellulales bacterium]|nr:nitrate reductase [Pirellulales bacterium]